MKKLLLLFFAAALLTACGGTGDSARNFDRASIVANPIDLNYRFQEVGEADPLRYYIPDQRHRREAADPVLEYYKGDYYLFASKSGGYWRSPDLIDWTHIPSSLPTIDIYAPTILVWRDSLYYMSSGHPRIFRSADPANDVWDEIDCKLQYYNWDPAFFADDDGRIYLYWGCSNVDPIVGVEVDPDDGFRALGVPDTLILHNHEKYGWEEPDRGHRAGSAGYNEGPCMTKHNGRYYLQYAAPGTEFRIYADGVYVSDHPLGPYTYMQNSPFSFKPGGFIGGAGHGHTFLDKYGNYWHVATMTIAVRHMFERRLALYPVWFGDDGGMYAHTVFTDYPFSIPNEKVDFATDDRWTGWNLLSYRKTAFASSEVDGYEAGRANDEEVETWWAAVSGNAGEWWQTDLGREMEVQAVQIDFADHSFTNTPEESYVFYQYTVEHSSDGENWAVLVDRTDNTRDAPHELVVLPEALRARFLRITNTKELAGNFSLSGFRVFGSGLGKAPAAPSGLSATRNPSDRRELSLAWDDQPDADGYIIRWGIAPDRLNSAMMVYTNHYSSKIFNAEPPYYFTIEAFNDTGVSLKTKTVSVE